MSIRVHRRRLTVLSVGLVLVGSLFLWVWTSGIYYRPLPKPACAIQLPFVTLQACASDEGIYLLAMQQRGLRLPTFHFGSFGSVGHHHGWVINLLGLVIAVLPTEFNGGDYSVPPHLALVLPYWLLMLGSGYLLLVLTPAAASLRQYCRLSKVSGGAAGVVCVLIATLNIVPSAWRPGAAIRPQTIREWVALTIQPQSVYSEIMLVYGFPFPCYRKGIINGQSVNLFYGASVGWEPHKAMENVCAAMLAGFAIVLVIEWLRHRASCQQTALPNKSLNPTGNKPSS